MEFMRLEWTFSEAIERLFLPSDKGDGSLTKRFTFVERLLSMDDIDVPPLGDSHNVAARAVVAIKQILPNVRSTFALPAMLWVRWAMRHAELPIAADFFREFSVWLVSTNLDTLRFQRFAKAKKGDKSQLSWIGPKRNKKKGAPVGYTIEDILTRERLISSPLSTQAENMVVLTPVAEIFEFQWRMRQLKKRRQAEVVGKPFLENLLSALEAFDAQDNKLEDGDRKFFEKRRDKKKKYISRIRKPDFIALLQRQSYFKGKTESFLSRAVSIKVAFPRGRAPVESKKKAKR